MRSLFLLIIMTLTTPIAATAADQPPLIPREVLFGNPTQTQARIAPDGSHLSWLAPSADGVLNVWVQPVDRSSPPRQVTDDKVRGIRMHTWAEDSRRLLYLQDQGGDENWHLYVVNLDSGEVKDLTPYEGVRAENLITDPGHPGELLIGLNRRDPSVFDMYRIDLASGETTLETENPGDVVDWITDADFRIRAAMASDMATGDTLLRVRDTPMAEWRDLIRFPFGENGAAYAFDASGKRLQITSSLGSDTTRLIAVDAKTGKELDEIAAHPKSDVAGVMMHPTEHRIEAVEFDYQRPEWRVVDAAVKDDLAFLENAVRGTPIVGDRTHNDDHWIIAYAPDDGPASYHLYHRAERRLEPLFVTRPDLTDYPLAKMRPVLIPARDGLTMPSYLTLPPEAAGNGDDKPAKPLPMVLLVHGGPWARDSWGFDPNAQWLANRGYAVLQVNFRGSTGFGKAFLNAGNGEWGVGAMQHDLTDAVRWAIEQGIADRERVCIYGGSYGGYATLAGLTFTPDLYACGVDIVGPSNIATLFASIPPYWAPMRKQLVRRVGDIENDSALNRRISPLFHVDEITAPLMVLQGANDPRVKMAESDQIVSAMREKDLPVTYLVFPDEGHGFARPENRMDANAYIEQFLAEQLGGRAEPREPIDGSTAELR